MDPLKAAEGREAHLRQELAQARATIEMLRRAQEGLEAELNATRAALRAASR
jgi:hypothetical protein